MRSSPAAALPRRRRNATRSWSLLTYDTEREGYVPPVEPRQLEEDHGFAAEDLGGDDADWRREVQPLQRPRLLDVIAGRSRCPNSAPRAGTPDSRSGFSAGASLSSS